MAQNTLKVGSKLMVSVGNKSYPVTLKQGYYLTTPGGQVVPEWRSCTKDLGNNVTKAANAVRNLTMKGKPARNNTRRNNITQEDISRADSIAKYVTETLPVSNDGGGYSITMDDAVFRANEAFKSKKMNAFFRQYFRNTVDPDGSLFTKRNRYYIN
jgi:hypothetical protein